MSSWCSNHYTQDDCGSADPRTTADDEVSDWALKASRYKQLKMYQLLYNLGIRTSGIDYEIEKAWREESKVGKA